MLRAPIALEKMRYAAATGTVIYRSKMHLGLKRNFHLMPGAEWLALLLHHLPERYEHLVRYVGWYSNRWRGEARIYERVRKPCQSHLGFGCLRERCALSPALRLTAGVGFFFSHRVVDTASSSYGHRGRTLRVR